MAIHPDDIEQVRRLTDITAIVSERTPLVHAGRRQVGDCPFCDEKTGTFAVNKTTGRFLCFSCQQRGDVFTFVQLVHSLTYEGAVRYLAARVGFLPRSIDDDLPPDP